MPCMVYKDNSNHPELVFYFNLFVFTGKTSNLSSGAKVSIIVLPAIATLAFVMGVLYAFRRRKAMIKYREKLFNSFKDVDYGKFELQ